MSSTHQAGGRRDQIPDSPCPPPPPPPPPAISTYPIDLSAALQLRNELDYLYSGGPLQMNAQGHVILTGSQYALFGDQNTADMSTHMPGFLEVELFHLAGLVCLRKHFGSNNLVKEVATKLLPRLQALAAPDKDMISVGRLECEKLVKYLEDSIKIKKNGEVITGRLKGAYPLKGPTGNIGYMLRVSGVKEREVHVNLYSLADGSTSVSLDEEDETVLV